MSNDLSRRKAIKTITIVVGGVITLIELPARWSKPVVESIIAPAHAALSGIATTTTTTTTTSTTTTTTTTTQNLG